MNRRIWVVGIAMASVIVFARIGRASDIAGDAPAGTAAKVSRLETAIDEVRHEVKLLTEQNKKLVEQSDELVRQNAELMKFKGQAEAAQVAAQQTQTPPTNNVPAYTDVKLPTVVNDIKCRPVLKYDDKPTDDHLRYCHPLSPWERLLVENLAAGAGYTYANLVGFQNVALSLPLFQQTTSSYQVGGGFSGKPILKQLRAALWDPDPVLRPREVTEQGSTLEDLLFNAVQINAGGGYGRSLQIKNGVVATSETSRPSFSVGVSYVVDLERLYIHATRGDWSDTTRPVDAGYFFSPAKGFWKGTGEGNSNGLIATPPAS